MERRKVSDFFNGQSLFITGGTGLMGKVLVEKLIYTCPQLENIYVLIRQKRNKSVQTRIEEMFKTPLFNRLRESHPEWLKKIVPIEGDVGVDGLGISDSDRKTLIDRVTVVVHGAATLRLEAKLKDAVNLNTEGTLRVMQLCKEIKNIKVVVHLSTAFCHVDHEVMEEKVYPPPANPLDIIDLCHWMEESALEVVTPRLISPHPNCYTYSKRLAEYLAGTFQAHLPLVIIRPSIVTPAWRDPLPGWVDNLNGPVGLIVGGAKGVIRSMHCNADLNAEVIPVDMAINGIIAIIAKIGSEQKSYAETPVFNLTQSGTKLVTWREVVQKGKICAYENPFELMLWYPGGGPTSNKLSHDLTVIFCHWLPAYLIDFLMIIFGQKPFMLRVQRKIQDGLDVLQYFTLRQWNFPNPNLLQVRDSMDTEDKITFTLDFEAVDTMDYLRNCILGSRHYLMKEDPKSIPRCRRNIKIFWAVDRLCKLFLVGLLLWLFFRVTSSALTLVFGSGSHSPEL